MQREENSTHLKTAAVRDRADLLSQQVSGAKVLSKLLQFVTLQAKFQWNCSRLPAERLLYPGALRNWNGELV